MPKRLHKKNTIDDKQTQHVVVAGLYSFLSLFELIRLLPWDYMSLLATHWSDEKGGQ
jgi:hypothetical protein